MFFFLFALRSHFPFFRFACRHWRRRLLRGTCNNSCRGCFPFAGRHIIETVSELIYTPKNEREYGTLACWAKNSIGKQTEPCLFQVVPAGNLFSFLDIVLRSRLFFPYPAGSGVMCIFQKTVKARRLDCRLLHSFAQITIYCTRFWHHKHNGITMREQRKRMPSRNENRNKGTKHRTHKHEIRK